MAKITICSYTHFTPSPPTGWTNLPINEVYVNNLNWRQIFSCQYIHVKYIHFSRPEPHFINDRAKRLRQFKSAFNAEERGKLKHHRRPRVGVKSCFAHSNFDFPWYILSPEKFWKSNDIGTGLWQKNLSDNFPTDLVPSTPPPPSSVHIHFPSVIPQNKFYANNTPLKYQNFQQFQMELIWWITAFKKIK